MLSPLKKPQNNEEDINQQLHGTIYKKVTKKTHNHESQKKMEMELSKNA
ncbi:hypothetical protein [Wolbachia endosymbiont of Zygogramma bicolorata]